MPMVPKRLILSVSPIFILVTLAIAQPPFRIHSCLNDKGNYTANSTYHANLNTLLTSLFSNEPDINGYGAFQSSSHGRNPDKAYAIGLCRGDVEPDVCRRCLTNSTNLLTKLCPNQKEAIGWYDQCMLRYSNRSIYGIKETDPAFFIWNTQNASSDVDAFQRDVQSLFEDLSSRAVAGGSLRKFAAGSRIAANNFQTIYGIAQCTPDLSDVDCNDCLNTGVNGLTQYCKGSRAATLFMPICRVAYDLQLFYDAAAVSPPPPPTPILSPSPPLLSPLPSTNGTTENGTSFVYTFYRLLDSKKSLLDALIRAEFSWFLKIAGKKSQTYRIVISVVVPILVLTAIMFFVYICLCVRKAKESVRYTDDEKAESLQFQFCAIKAVTNDFSEANKLGQGGFGAVYRGRLLNGGDIAVKRLCKNSGQGDIEFRNEILLVARLQHRNLVSLLGFCLEQSERLLIYEFVPNSSLDHHVFDPIKRASLDWNVRYKIIVGIAQGLLYLHEDSRLKVIHRDLKASNILLDAEMNPKIADFGMAKLFTVDQTQSDTTRIVGTYGYMAPEYVKRGHHSVKSDVFSFGVLILEIVSGQSIKRFSTEEKAESLLSYAWKKWKEGLATNLVDPKMNVGGSKAEIMQCIHIGLLCVQENLHDRPTMRSVALSLSSCSVSLQVPSKPAYFMDSSTNLPKIRRHISRMRMSNRHQNNIVQASENQASLITEVHPR
ncbi:cysteine-rich receptor-like protein kinase 10 isoform X2 [Ziziphus jujuba]|uniref:Cysteine-rich receptor-like protein kinase 10 isoform X2 n=1 Tax=Ziziphus jujuba TaxID=326968 RepID=A0ABM4A4Q2_ZIZJJ|nr:cysteine-rich receptor-like protein kinase 10 isoform X2 [Ziziphus jujuba]